MRVPLSRAPHAHDLPLPSYATEGASGADLYAAVDTDVILAPGERATVPTGVHLALPAGYEGQVRPRSGLAARLGLGMVNAPGTIDSDYRGEIAVILINWGEQPVTLRRGDRVAQLVIAPIVQAEWEDRGDTTLPPTPRGAGGFGHTGLRPLEKGDGADVSDR